MVSESPETNHAVKERAAKLAGIALLSALVYAVLLCLSWLFVNDPNYNGPTPAWMPSFFNNDAPGMKPTVWMLSLFGVQFLFYFLAIWMAVRITPTRWLLGSIFAAACLFRAIMLPSVPMHEIDIYRYIWDGAVFAEGISPYRYTPKVARETPDLAGPNDDPILQQVVELRERSYSLKETLWTVHQEHLPSPYPVVSQIVFATSAVLTPDEATYHTRLMIMKSLLVLMDLATLVVVMLLLHAVGMHPGWSLAYGWCPLVLKEIANGGHLDSIAIFLTTLAVWLLVKTWQSTSLPKWLGATLSGSALALAISAKLYPVVLVPLFAAVWLRRSGWLATISGLATAAAVSTVLLYSLLYAFFFSRLSDATPQQVAEPEQQVALAAGEGINKFLDTWEMNDLIFTIVCENLRQQDHVRPERKPWFAFTSDEWARETVDNWVGFKKSLRSRWTGLKNRFTEQEVDQAKANQVAVPEEETNYWNESFSLARAITGGVFGLVACLLAWFAAGKEDPRSWCRAAMLTIAWFWLTCPTQNPWYWCWVLPFLPFARYRTWFVVAALTMLYYLRFWYSSHYANVTVASTPYYGEFFFYFVIAWVEFLPVYIALAVEWFYGLKSAKSAT